MHRHALLVGVERYPGLGDTVRLHGCRNDVELVASVLRERFGFGRDGRFDVLLDDDATRDGLVAALERLRRAIEPGDVAVVYYSGHGSQITDLEGDEGDGLDETIVPFDATRRGPNREITDDEIHAWLAATAERSLFVTTIFDCCHAGSLRRHAGGARIRRVAPDRRPAAALRRPPAPPWGRRRWRHAGRPCVSDQVHLAACRDDELAGELMASQTGAGVHGAFTFHLCRALLEARGDATWRDVMERVRSSIVAHDAGQTPQLEGARDRLLFGVGDLPPRRHVLVRARRADASTPDGAQVELSAGAALGLTVGSHWRVAAAGARDASVPVGHLRLDALTATRAVGVLLEEVSPGVVTPGCRAFEEVHRHADPVLGVAFGRRDVPNRELPPTALGRLHRRLEAAPLLRPASPDAADVQVWALGRRRAVDDASPVPQLGPLDAPVWVLVDAGGRLLGAPRALSVGSVGSVGSDEAVRLDTDFETILSRLVRQARWRRALALENLDPASRLRGRVGLELLQRAGDGWQRWPEDAEPVYAEGGRLALAIENRAAVPIYPYVLDFGLTGGIELLFPPFGGHEPLDPGATLRTGLDRDGAAADRSIRLGFPRDWPTVGAPRRAPGLVKLFATTAPVDIELLTQPLPWRASPHAAAVSPTGSSAESSAASSTASSAHPLERLLALGDRLQRLRGLALDTDARRTEQAPGDDWTTVVCRYTLVSETERPVAEDPDPPGDPS